MPGRPFGFSGKQLGLLEEGTKVGQNSVYRITDLAESERPRERLSRLGPQSLTDAELLAILLRVGVHGENAVQVGQRLLQELGGLAGLHRAAFEDVCNQHGVGPAKAAQISPSIARWRSMPEDRPSITARATQPPWCSMI
jgi:DNA repair protein RadC